MKPPEPGAADPAGGPAPLPSELPADPPTAPGTWGPETSPSGPSASPDADDTLDLRLCDVPAAGWLPSGAVIDHLGPVEPFAPELPAPRPDLLDSVAAWPAAETPVGTLRLVPVRPQRDVRLIAAWMNDPAVAAFWELDGPQEVTAAHLRSRLDGDGRSVPCLGVLDGVPMSYWEIYRADLDPLARHFRARPHDTGLHLLIGGVPDRGRGLGTALLRAVADLVLDRRPRCGRVLAEPDVRNVASVAAFLSAGFRLSAEVDLPGKRAALMVRDRALREVL
ncbi:GNAT family N-acetyltransferase [Streptomyces nanshensis]|uniref:GNAT family N-acetyltransferase n=1 Tax=Streptomyces nanshensis TaxID=518642 RepID=UPI000A4B5CEA|nr:GNAT family N-acetyltransferase [Streptomyces nanshensis]